MANEPLVVQAVYSYKRSNNDELNFKKGDIITVTQKDDGWWEGTLNGETGWFPSNYVKECKGIYDFSQNIFILNSLFECFFVDAPKPIINQLNEYKSVVLKDLVDSEKAHVTELEGLVTNFLQPLEKSAILTTDEYKQLTGNITEVLETHQHLLNLIEIESNKPGCDQRVGKLFLNWAPRIKSVHQAYCSLHPKAVCILDKYRDELTKYMESKGAASPGVLVLTTMLSKPFRRLDKYSGMLQELERHVEECHPDRGDTQRSVSVYKEIAATCSATRRQKELELQVLTGPVRGWEGPSLTTLGDIIYMGLVSVGPQRNDRYFVLFPTTLLILSVSHRLSAFIYEGKLYLSGLTITKLENNAFEISAPMIDKRVVYCQNKEDADHWIELLKKQMPRSSTASTVSQKMGPSQAQFVPQPPPHLNQRGYCNRSSVISYKTPNDNRPITLPPDHYPSAAPFAALTKYFQKLIKQKIITRKLLKHLLYSEHLNKMSLNLVKIRHHKTEISIYTKDVHCRDSVIHCESDTDTDSSNNTDKTKNYDSYSSNSSNPFGYIRYYNPRNEDESKPPSILISTASIRLQKQSSQDSDGSVVVRKPKPYMACENILNLNDSLELTNLSVQQEYYLPTTRQSCPTKLVGNKFNKTSLTTIYIPPWSNNDTNNSTTHSSTLELPVNTLPIPDKVLAEILYNTPKDNEENFLLKPPSMFDVKIVPQSLSLNLDNVGFRKHSIDSDKPKRRSSLQITPSTQSSFCRCCSVYYHSPRSSDSGMAGSCTLNSPDSANNTAESARVRCSVDMTNLFDKCEDKRDALSLSESIARDYEAECQCTSPFGSTPRTSGQDCINENVITKSGDGIRKSQSKLYLIPQKSQSMDSLLDKEEGDDGNSPLFKSGLYAHWWLKAKIPASVVKGIRISTRQNNTDDTTDLGKRHKHTE
ncbi:uncharacterized protein LOC130896115 isoform X1 [Diorhabda carinulata]|uniref:uncharacterized protein LOC130896115 isoform X1 n=1 Tax=Diorhabda carinulata TaxID=1163345 RepID=UPI0025A29962|nr:uncharacterized protein LOC130896115 isoform X1 [Diorhabda carinulata]XP_057659893.1 uncharacterized protein LOC130896115 isoform X1 [Diorhabda carinulata]